MRKPRMQPAPWYVAMRQYDARGRGTRPRIVDSGGKPVRLGNVRQATLMAMAPVLAEVLVALGDLAEMQHLQIQSLHGFRIDRPKVLTEAARVTALLRRLGYL